MWSEECVKCRVWSVECKVKSVKCSDYQCSVEWKV